MAQHPVVIVSDLDHTMVQNEDASHQRLLAFNHVWTSHFRSPDNLLVFSTGRSPTLFKQLWQEAPLLTPDVLICSVGTEIFYNTSSKVASLLAGSHTASLEPQSSFPPWAQFAADPSWEAVLDQGWDRPKVVQLVEQHFPQLVMQVATEQRPHKVSYTLKPGTAGGAASEEVVERLRQVLEQQGLQAKVIYSGGQDLDVLSAQAGKGCGLAFLLQQLRQAGYNPTYVQVNGDSGNDRELFEVAGVVGCVVANAHPELREYAEQAVSQGGKHIHQARNPCAGGIIETMLQFGLVPPTSPVLTAYKPLLQLSSTSSAQGGTEPVPPAVHPVVHASAVPDTAEPCAPHGSLISGSTPAVPEGTAVIEAAAHVVGSPPKQSSALQRTELQQQVQLTTEGDTCYQQTAAGLPEQLLETSTCEITLMPGGGKKAAVDESAVSHVGGLKLTSEEAAREWVWRLGAALVPELLQGTLTRGKLPAHSALRLFVTNDCQIGDCAPTPPNSSIETSEASAASSDERGVLSQDVGSGVQDITAGLQATGVADAAAQDVGSAASRSWVDQVQVAFREAGAGFEWEAGKFSFTASFKVCLVQPDGMRSRNTWPIDVEALLPAEPAPHGFLARCIRAMGPLSVPETQLGLPGAA